MALEIADRVKETTTTTSTGTYALAGAVDGFQSFAAVGNGNTTYYACTDGTDYEVGIGSFTLSGNTLTRVTILESSNSDAAVSWGAGTKEIFVTVPAEKYLVRDASGNVSLTGNLTISGTVDGRDVSADGSKLDGIESGATADQTAAQIRAKVEAASDSNVFTDADHSKLNGIEAGATGDQTNAEIRAAVEAATDSNVFTDADHSKLNGIEANAKNDQTITAGGGLIGGGTGDVTISHSDTSSVSSTDNSGNTFVQDLTFDTYGHVTAVGTGSVSVGNGTLTVQGTGALGGSGTFTANQSGNTTISISHDDTSSQASVNGSGRTYIQDVTLDAYGHVTGLATATETVVNTDTNTTDWRVQNSGGTQQFAVSAAEGVRFAGSGATSVSFDAVTQKITISSTDTNTDTNTIPNNATITLSAGGALTGGGNFTTDQSSNETITFNHSDTSSQGSVNNSSGTVIQDVTLDGYGHVTGLASVNLDGRYYTETEADSRFVNVTGDTITGNLTVDNGTSTTLSVKCDDGGNALVRANGDNQGTGALEVGQSNAYGGGISYNGDGSPSFVSGETADNITFYRLENGTRTEVFHYPYNSNTVNFNSTPTAGGTSLAKTTDIGNGTLTVQGTGALGGSGTFTANQSGNTTISISHDDTSSQGSVNNSGNTVIQDVTLDGYGHVTGLTSKTLSIPSAANNATITLSAGTGLSGGGNFTTNQSSAETITFNLEAPYTYIDTATGSYGTIKVDDDRGVSWAGYAIRDDWVLMSDGANNCGLYNDTDNEWAWIARRNGEVELYHNGSNKLETRSDGVAIVGNLIGATDIYVDDQIISTGDTDTYMQFHAANQWRVVVGGSERLEVKNSSPHVLVSGDLNSTSDERLKKNIKPIDNALADICQLEGVTFDWRDTGTQGQGFIAQQVEPIIPDVVNTDEDTGMKSINYVGLIGHLVEAIKTQQTQIDDLKAEIQSMKS